MRVVLKIYDFFYIFQQNSTRNLVSSLKSWGQCPRVGSPSLHPGTLLAPNCHRNAELLTNAMKQTLSAQVVVVVVVVVAVVVVIVVVVVVVVVKRKP